jgi:hypothetical protein
MDADSRKILLITLSILALFFLGGCPEFHRVEVNVHLLNQPKPTQITPELDKDYYQNAVRLIDDLGKKYGLKCRQSDDTGYHISCGIPPLDFYYSGTFLESNINRNTGVLFIELMGNQSQKFTALQNELIEAFRRSFPEGSISLNPVHCTPPYEKKFKVKLHDRKPALLYFWPGSIDQEFKLAATMVGDALRKYDTKGGIPYSISKDWFAHFSVGEIIGVQKRQIRVDLYGSAHRSTLDVRVIDNSCRESELMTSILGEIEQKLTEHFRREN